ncbi:C-type lectin BfL-2-like [Protopterus annectens]|uniref:C-type lectin BfL-2-like n=1 Tax=Protopterus annectens TaxID=7888 RepID=UPI001CFBE380|nr:C-type lectin BfL-2-like [Protopterus annectens]
MNCLILMSAILVTFFPKGDTQVFNHCICVRGLCPSGWYQYKDSCYRVITTPTSWVNAEASCQKSYSGAHLASIHSDEENNYIFSLTGNLSDYTKGNAYWIGAHDTLVEGSYMWTDGTVTDYLHFGTGQPDNLGNEDFIGSWFVQNGAVTWNDYPASWSFPYVCKFSLNRCCLK